MTFAVELPGVSGRVLLLVSLPCSRPDAWWGERTMAVRPALMMATIRMALDRGWHPRRTGSAFDLALDDEDVTELMHGQPPAYDVPFMRSWLDARKWHARSGQGPPEKGLYYGHGFVSCTAGRTKDLG
ncbi:hypothetical protein ACBR40_10765 [Nonomuraea sp. AD125B]|uniref:hypothetical protein n=1 Tax=Nonomuraea sp. AD125B TaxID=3242897 RepID=UPI003528BFF6